MVEFIAAAMWQRKSHVAIAYTCQRRSLETSLPFDQLRPLTVLVDVHRPIGNQAANQPAPPNYSDLNQMSCYVLVELLVQFSVSGIAIYNGPNKNKVTDVSN
jgi:hypothetical protein